MNRVINFWSITGVISVALFVSVELSAAAAAAVWAVSGLFRFGTPATIAFGALVAVPSLYGIARVFVLAFNAETDPQNN